MRREIAIWHRDPVLLTLVLIVPPLLFTLICLIYNTGVIHDLPVAVCDMDRSALSRQIIRAIDADPSMAVSVQVQSPKEIEKGIRDGRFSGGFFFPENMERDIKYGKTAYPVVYKNSQNLMTGNTLYKESMTIFRTFNAGIVMKNLGVKGVGRQEALAAANTVAADVRILYNPNFSYTQFMCPGIIFAQLQAIIMMTALLIMAREYQKNTINDLLAIAGNRRTAILFGKAFPYVTVFTAICLGVIGILFPLFNIHLSGPFLPTLGIIVLFIAASFAPGLLLGLLITSPVFAVTVAIVINMPAFIFGGFTFPLWAMPDPIVAIAQVLPFTHFSQLFFKVCMIKAPFSYCTGELLKLLAFTCVPLPFCWALLHVHVLKRRAAGVS